MAPIKFEDKLKDKLENRSLQPSEDAWNTLANRLDKEDKKNNNTKFWWLGIAASIIGVILIKTQFYKSTETVKDLPIVVDTQVNTKRDAELIIQPVKIGEIVGTSEDNTKTVEINSTTEVASVSSKEISKSKKLATTKKVELQPEDTQDMVASIEKSKSETKDNSMVKGLSKEELKIIEVVDIIKQLQTDDTSVSDKEIDSLLKQAQREILKQQIYDETTKTVSADALLQDVEVELEQSFRDKVFEALKSGYGTVRTAVAERHN